MRKCWFTIFLAVNLAIAQPGSSTKYVVHTPDVELSYYVYGNTHSVSPVIVVNGGPGFDHRYMVQSDIWNTLAQRRQIVFYDQRGVGESKLINPKAEQTMAAQVADIEAIRVKLGVHQVCLLGDSWGGFVSMGYAAAHPEHVEMLVLVDSVDAYWDKSIELFTQVFPDIRPRDPKTGETTGDSVLDDKESLRKYFRMLFYNQENFAKVMAAMPPDLGANLGIYETVENAMGDLDLRPAIRKFNFPTLVTNGRFDVNEPPITAWNIYHAIPHAKFVIFEKSGHLPFYEEPEKFVQVVGDFLGGDPAGFYPDKSCLPGEGFTSRPFCESPFADDRIYP